MRRSAVWGRPLVGRIGGVDSVHTLGVGLGCAFAGLGQIGDVCGGVTEIQGLEPGSSPTSGTCFPCSGAFRALALWTLSTPGVGDVRTAPPEPRSVMAGRSCVRCFLSRGLGDVQTNPRGRVSLHTGIRRIAFPNDDRWGSTGRSNQADLAATTALRSNHIGRVAKAAVSVPSQDFTQHPNRTDA